jgi:hypothetical protein
MSNSHVIVIAVNGILTLPSDSDGWTDRLVVQINAAWPDKYRGDKYEYFCSPLLRMVGQEHRGEELFGLIGKYEPDKNRIHLVGHSNGCDLIERGFVPNAASGSPGCILSRERASMI